MCEDDYTTNLFAVTVTEINIVNSRLFKFFTLKCASRVI